MEHQQEAICGHIALFYYGQDHLKVNVEKLIQQETDKKSLILFFVEDELHDRISSFVAIENHEPIGLLKETEVVYGGSMTNIQFQDLEIKTERLLKEAINNGFSGITWFIDVKQLIKQTSKVYFLSWQNKMNGYYCRNKCSVISLYDFEDYMGLQEYIDNEIIENALRTHQKVVYRQTLIESANYANMEITKLKHPNK